MAQLDKTFPTNDCSACILAPKVTETFNHPLVSTMTWSEVEEIRGRAPDFKAVIRQRPAMWISGNAPAAAIVRPLAR
jgi:heterodisulfide reductase subunit A